MRYNASINTYDNIPGYCRYSVRIWPAQTTRRLNTAPVKHFIGTMPTPAAADPTTALRGLLEGLLARL